jgi:Glyoxalase/Bleomycin resistance protein/Dioxygenase superfamily
VTRPALVGLGVGGSIKAWAAAGFTVVDQRIRIGAVTVRLTGGRGGVESWALDPADADVVDGLALAAVAPLDETPDHPSTTTAIDHVVIASPDLDRTTEAFGTLGIEVRRIRDAGRMEQRFFRAGEVILELIGTPGAHGDGPATFWGLALTVADLDTAAARLGEHLGPVSDAVQRGRRIATLRHEPLGLAVPIAFMTAPPSRDPA